MRFDDARPAMLQRSQTRIAEKIIVEPSPGTHTRWGTRIAFAALIVGLCGAAYLALHQDEGLSLKKTGMVPTIKPKADIRTKLQVNAIEGQIKSKERDSGELEKTLVAEQRFIGAIDGLIYASRDYLKLTPEQVKILEADVLQFLHVKAAIEEPLVVATRQDDKTLKIDIPAYPELGDALRNSFNEQLASDLTPDVATRVDDALGNALDGFFRHYGQMSQQFTISDSSNGSEVTISWKADAPPNQDSTKTVIGSLAGSFSVDPNQLYAGEYEAIRTAIANSNLIPAK